MGYSSICYAHGGGYSYICSRVYGYLLCAYRGVCYARTIQTLPKHYTNRLKPLDSLSEPITALEWYTPPKGVKWNETTLKDFFCVVDSGADLFYSWKPNL